MAIRDETRMLLESMGRLFEDHCTKQVADAAETGVFAKRLWDAVAETGLPLAALPESAGGADAEWSDLYAALRVAGRPRGDFAAEPIVVGSLHLQIGQGVEAMGVESRGNQQQFRRE